MLSIFWFLIVAIGLVAAILVLCAWERGSLPCSSVTQHNFINGKIKTVRVVYMALVAALSVYGVLVAKEYMYPKDERVMRNTDCHVISHKGFEFADGRFYLANGAEGDSTGFPQLALWDDREGMAYVTGECICLKNFVEPFYVRMEGEKRFVLQNALIDADVDEGFTVERNGVPFCKVDIRYDKDKRAADYVLTMYVNGVACATDTSGFHEVIKRGYPLYDIVARVPSVNMDCVMEAMFSNSYLARQVYGDKESELRIMPGTGFYAMDSVTVNGQLSQGEYEKTIRGIGDCSFFAGIGKRATDQMNVRLNKEGGVNSTRLVYAVPHMKRLRAINGCVFVTSALDNVDLKMKDGGYLFNIFEQEDNFNHICAYFRYGTDKATDSLKVEVVDLYSDSEECNYVSGGEEFHLNTKNRNDATSWIFEITDLRKANDLKLWNLALLLWLFLLVVGVRFFLDYHINKKRGLSYFELGVYVVMVAFTVVRFVLCWRISTYIPIENISPTVYDVMRGNDFGYTYFICAIPVALAIRPWVIWSINRLKASMSRKKAKRGSKGRAKVQTGKEGERILRNANYVWRNGKVSIIYVVTLGICLALGATGINVLERICNIFIPVVCYFVFDIWTVKRGFDERRSSRNLLTQRVVNLIFTLAYLAKADAGFAVIFFIYSLFHTLTVQAFFHKYKKPFAFAAYLISIASLLIMWIVLRFEGGLMIKALKVMTCAVGYVDWVILVVGLAATALVWLTVKSAKDKNGVISPNEKRVCTGLILALTVASFLLVRFWVNPDAIAEKFKDKSLYQRYRAEIQDLKADEKIDSLILGGKFNSKSIEYVMRSAHNQWFINQYLAAGDSLDKAGKLYQTQPHSIQGATYPTQTTDLVVTRYVLAEHENAEGIVFLLTLLFVALVLIYIAEVQMDGVDMDATVNRAAIGGPLLLYLIALMVFLSATNRIVFVGQDFPFVSAQSKIAVLLPVMLMLIPSLRCQTVREKGQTNTEKHGNHTKGRLLLLFVILFTFGCTHAIARKGVADKGNRETCQKAEQFNVSEVIANVSAKVTVIDRVFVEYQHQVDKDSLKAMKPAEVWENFERSSYGMALLGDTTQGNDSFFASLLDYFRHNQVNKANPNEFLHLRRRDNICHLSVNKKQFFIPAIMQDSLRWTGSLLAAAIDKRYAICDMESDKSVKIDGEVNYRLNILPVDVQRKVPGIQMYQFSEEWTPDHKPLILIDSKKSLETKQYFSIFSDSSEYRGYGIGNQIAMALGWNDKFILYNNENGRDGNVVYVRKLKESSDNYLACNIWLNGKRRLFYPLGKESMWSYQIATLMSDAYSHTQFKDSTIRLSIDYDLHKKVYEMISHEVHLNTRPKMSKQVRNEIIKYKFLSYAKKCDPRAGLIYFDEAAKVFFLTARGAATSGMNPVVSFLNRQYAEIRTAYPGKDPSDLLTASVNQLLEGNNGYDFSAVAIDGEGRIRLLLDFTTKRNIDPNNIVHINKLLSELYCDGKTSDEIDIFGNKALQYIVPGPGSSLKPIAYTAVTSQEKINWESINVFREGQDSAVLRDAEGNKIIGKYLYYGGVEMKAVGEGPLNIEDENALQHNTYLTYSDNLYHSVIMMLGMQAAGKVNRVLTAASSVREPKRKFPTFSYNGETVCFDSRVWMKDNKLQLPDNSLFGEGMWKNFGIQQNTVRINSNTIANYYGNSDAIKTLYKNGGANKCWSFPLISSQNLVQRKMSPQIRNGFNQILLGSYPLQITPLQMAMNAYRMVTLNAARNIFTILDDVNAQTRKYRFFNIGESWNGNNNEYTAFVARQVWGQLAKVPTNGTAHQLNTLSRELNSKGYYLYCKTGTLNVEDDNEFRDETVGRPRVKHLLVVVSNKALEKITSESELADVKFYAMYFSYIGIDIDRESFSSERFQKYIQAVVNSEVFDSYMKN